MVRSDSKLRKLVEAIWSYGSRSMFSWFTEAPTVSFKYCPRTVAEEFKKDYREDFAGFGNSVDNNHFLFEPGDELDEYCSLLEQSLKLLKLEDPLLVQRKVYLGTRIDEQLHTCERQQVILTTVI